MSWTDRSSIKVINYLKDKFKVRRFVETGTYMGVNALLHSQNFEEVFTCESNKEFFDMASKRLEGRGNIFSFFKSSPEFLKKLGLNDIEENTIIYLDAHFYNPELPSGKGKFVILDELKSLKGLKNVILIIHDFDNNLGHITYDDISLDMDLIGESLIKVNPNFFYYTNELASCDIVTPTSMDILKSGLRYDKETIENLEYAWIEPRLTYRGILYCLPKQLTKREMKRLGLRRWS